MTRQLVCPVSVAPLAALNQPDHAIDAQQTHLRVDIAPCVDHVSTSTGPHLSDDPVVVPRPLGPEALEAVETTEGGDGGREGEQLADHAAVVGRDHGGEAIGQVVEAVMLSST